MFKHILEGTFNMSTESWKLENDLCRCCHSEGKFKNLSEPCKKLGLEVIYSDMLKDCFDINVVPIPGSLCTATYTICDGCICRLRDAADFRKQVLACEERFRDMYDKNVFKVAEPLVGVKEEPDTFTDADEEFKKESSQDDHDDCDDSLDLNFEDDQQEEVESRKKKKKQKPDKKSCKSVGKKKGKQESLDDEAEKKKVIQRKDPYYTQETGEDGSKKFTCTVCHRSYKTYASVAQHHKHVHLRLQPKLRSCLLCPIKVPGYKRAFHLEEKHGIPAPSCNACGKKFAYPFQVLTHQKHFHMGEKSFKCPNCPLKFTSASRLSCHAIKHTDVRPYKCEMCEKAFRWKKNLRTHIMMHLDERKHVCSVCQEAFVQQSSLTYHVTKRHPEMA